MKIGDKVVWSNVGRSGRTISFQKRYGTIVQIDGDQAQVKYDSGYKRWVALSILRLRSEDTPLSIFGDVA